MMIPMCPLAQIKEHQHQLNCKLSESQTRTWTLNEHYAETINNKINQ